MPNKPEMNLDLAVKAMRDDVPQNDAVQASADRVWQRVNAASAASVMEHADLASCAGVRAELNAQRSGKKNSARALLVESHLHECANCRAYAAGERAQVVAWNAPVATKPMFNMRMVAIAATVLFVVGISSVLGYNLLIAGPEGPRATVQSLEGPIYRVASSGERAMKVGEQIGEGELVRTAAGARAFLKLADGSVVEMNERTQLAVKMGRRNTTVKVDRGVVLVQAAKRRTGNLFVDANDMHVAVTGTIFAVNSGTIGSRVAVVEGEVHATPDGGKTAVLHSGDQLGSAGMGTASVHDEIAWSRNADEYLKLLGEFAALQKKFEQIQLPGLRYQSRLLNYVPDGTLVYAGVPNYGDAIAEAYKLFSQQLQESETLRQWWNQKGGLGKNEAEISRMVQHVQEVSHYLGDEIVVAVSDMHSRQGAPIFVSGLKKSGFKEYMDNFVSEQLAKEGRTGKKVSDEIRWLDENSIQSAIQNDSDLSILLRGDLVAISPSVEQLKAFDRKVREGNGNFAQSGLGQRVAGLYQGGAGLFVAADLASIRESLPKNTRQSKDDGAALRRLGFDNVEYLIAQRKDVNGKSDNRASVSFAGERHGLASWLAAPAPIGSLEFISPDARVASAAVVKNPAAMFDDMFAGATAQDVKGLDRAQSELGINIREDLAAALGGDFAFAVDGPVLPTPAWRMVFEVNDANRLQGAIENLILAANRESAKKNGPTVEIQQEVVNNRTFYVVKKTGGSPMEVHYTYSEGYLVAAPTRGFVMAALQTKESGMSLASSDQFRALLPPTAHTNFSAMLYQNLAPVMEPLMQNADNKQAELLQKLAADRTPTVIAAFGERDRIEIASTSKLLGLDLRSMAAVQLLGMRGSDGTNK